MICKELSVLMLQSPAISHASMSRSLAIRLIGVALLLGAVIGGTAALLSGTPAPAIPARAAAAPPAVHNAAPPLMRQIYPPGVMAAAPKPVAEVALAPSVIV